MWNRIGSRQQGLTLVELIVVVAVITILGSYMYEPFVSALRTNGKIENERRLNALAQGIERAYSQNIGTVSADVAASSGKRLRFRGASGTIVSLDQTTALVPAQVNELAPYLPKDGGGELAFDGRGNAFVIYVSGVLTDAHRGVTYPYRVIKVVSPGFDGTLSTLETDTNAKGDDEWRVVDGRASMRIAIDAAFLKVDTLRAGLERYYETRYLVDQNRDPLRSYYANAPASGATAPASLYDAAGGLPSVQSPVALSPYRDSVGFGVAALALSWDESGASIQFVNASATERHPANATASLATPPYTFAVIANVPWATAYGLDTSSSTWPLRSVAQSNF